MTAYLSLMLASVLNLYTPSYPNLLTIKSALHDPLLKHKLISMRDTVLEKLYSQSNSANLMYTLKNTTTDLHQDVIDKVVVSLECVDKYNISHNQILTVIDYSLPSNQKRLWVFDLEKNKLLYHTYVGHGISSGTLLTDYFSNKYDSKATSLGVYRTEQAYYGREGRSLRLQGLDYSFNDNASNRYIVMHGGWYMSADFIKKYGRSGRSWGCPALPLSIAKPIIETIKDNSLIVMYYPSDSWFSKSRFLNCTHKAELNPEIIKPLNQDLIPREYVYFGKFGKDTAILVLEADLYKKTFNQSPPLKRMLRRRINGHEYIALTNQNLEALITKPEIRNLNPNILDELHFVIPTIKMQRGYYTTQMEFISHPEITSISMIENPTANKYIIHFSTFSAIQLTATNQFI